MTEPATVSNAALLLLCRLLVPGKTPPKDAALRKDVRSAAGPINDEIWAGLETQLQAAGYVERPAATPSGKSKKPRPTPLRLTEPGRQAAMRFLGVTELPVKLTWSKLTKELLFPATVAPADRGRTTDKKKLAAYLLADAVGVPPADDVNGVVIQIVAAELGMPDATGWDDVVRITVGRKLGVEFPKMPLKKLLGQIPKAVFPDVRDAKPDGIKANKIRAWAAGTSPVGGTPGPAATTSSKDITVDPLPSFAAEVHRLAAAATDGRFGSNKIFIARLWDQWPVPQRPALEEFKARLITAHRRDLLTLSRADLVAAMDPADVARSEARYENAEFHFVLIEPGRA